jgi:ferredoxin
VSARRAIGVEDDVDVANIGGPRGTRASTVPTDGLPGLAARTSSAGVTAGTALAGRTGHAAHASVQHASGSRRAALPALSGGSAGACLARCATGAALFRSASGRTVSDRRVFSSGGARLLKSGIEVERASPGHDAGDRKGRVTAGMRGDVSEHDSARWYHSLADAEAARQDRTHSGNLRANVVPREPWATLTSLKVRATIPALQHPGYGRKDPMSNQERRIVKLGGLSVVAAAHPAHVALARLFGSVKIMGPPMSDKLVELVAHLYTADEAVICTGMSFLYPRSVETISRICKRDPSQVLPSLRSMAERRIVFGSEDKFMLYPLIPGLFEYVFMTGPSTPWHARYAQLLDELYGTGYVSEYLTRDISAVRNIPVGIAIDGTNHVADDALISTMLNAHEHFAMLKACPCRHAKSLVGHTCKRATPEDGCLLFGDYTKSTVSNGSGRAVSRAEMTEILAERRRKKLVFLTANVDPKLPNVVCTCCDCCCHALETANHYSNKFIAPPHCVAQVDEERCSHCGVCVQACNSHAHVLDDDKHRWVSDRCMGCGYCVGACKRDAIRMIENPSFKTPAKGYWGLLLKMLPPVLLMGAKIRWKRAFGTSDAVPTLPSGKPES